MSTTSLRLERERTAVLLVDIQERLLPAMPPEVRESVVRNARLLVGGAKALRLPVFCTEQYPRGLGATVAELAAELPEGTKPIEKLTFSSCGADGFWERLRASNVKQVLLAGMETHVCVLQTAIDLLQEGIGVWLLADAVCSRSKSNWRTGLELAERAGAVVASTETALFMLLGRAGTSEFKEVSRLVK